MQLYLRFRIDDLSINTDLDRLENDIVVPIRQHCANNLPKIKPHFVFGVSPAVYEMPKSEGPAVSERIFPAILNAHSNPAVFYKPQKLGIPDLARVSKMDEHVSFCAHGMFHIDHRLISKEAQEINIISSLSLVEHECKTHDLDFIRAFIPPFNKTNSDTTEIGKDHRVHIVAWDEYRWTHLAYLKDDISVIGRNIQAYYLENPLNKGIYLHTHDFPDRHSIRRRIGHIVK